jgi:hypothetical protein
MAWIPIAIAAGKTLYDMASSTSKDDEMRKAGAAKIAAMRQGAGQVENYRQGLTPQMMQAMQNQMGAYGGAQSVLAQMYGGRPGTPVGQMPGAPAAGSFRAMGNRPILGAQSNLTRPSGPLQGPRNGPILGAPMPPNRMMGFGGELPMPMDLLGRRVG